MAKLTLEQKVSYMRIGLSLCEIGVNDAAAEIIVKTYEGILKKGGNFSIEDAVKIEVEVKGKYNKKTVEAKPDTTKAE
jgi:hypothetical protein